ncbi:flagellar biosynthesis protein FlgA [Candidatus Kaiserbacteria bacterium RIFCSPHIGHO2_12_FULL_53_13]|uniref:Flagellar biosynthesis protein FlgA n=1 Tax=Candidatus Kaiserbacteria bacterium RIFCSPHIGHO2_12_FULL_53_13 TaxID=1798502 RepID=A0A1F6EBW7_9BACT|nr:MAG: flagellar biosynthesis protein FlgA [Candidatus Kaiserbacteria bacterium RIFCSPHIGHO2_12_FULL_53_13]OGG74702.1 MAG: flagellar biosynthesis protein FlgA [Candidatus Kaiserbacteria bacterium RIFCSPLOWO2_01_FULL_52_36]
MKNARSFNFSKTITINGRRIGEGHPTYFIAEIGANFDGSLELAKKYAWEAKQFGADCAKIQSFKAKRIVSRRAFASMKLKGVHGSWKRPVDEVFEEVEFPRKWHQEFFDYCRSIGITPSSAPYDYEAVDLMEKCGTDFYKIGSGDITWLEMVEYIARKGKPVILATGASTLAEVDDAVRVIEATGNKDLAILQCITNYPSKIESANINVLNTYKEAFGAIVGYSDHSPGDTVVLGAVALGAKVIEKHFTLNRKNKGPDHPHSMEPQEFADMIRRTRELESALGTSRKDVVAEESETVIVQRRGLTAAKDIRKGVPLKKSDIIELRPALGIYPKFKSNIVGKHLKKSLKAGSPIRWEDIA